MLPHNLTLAWPISSTHGDGRRPWLDWITGGLWWNWLVVCAPRLSIYIKTTSTADWLKTAVTALAVSHLPTWQLSIGNTVSSRWLSTCAFTVAFTHLSQKLLVEQSAIVIVSDSANCRPTRCSDSTIVLTLMITRTAHLLTWSYHVHTGILWQVWM